MEITWYGLSCFRIVERGRASVVTDPYEPGLGPGKPKLKADIVTVSSDSPAHAHLGMVKSGYRAITGPGEYEIGGVFVTAIPVNAKKDGTEESKNGSTGTTLFVLDYDGIMVAHLGDLRAVPTQSQIENLGTVDVALVPVGGGEGLTPAQAAEVISLIEPSLVIPMQYQVGKEKLKLGKVDPFLSEMGISEAEAEPSLKVTKSGLSEETQVVLLECAT